MLPDAKEDDANADQRPNLGLDFDWIWTGLGLSSISPTIHCTGGPFIHVCTLILPMGENNKLNLSMNLRCGIRI